MSEREGVADGRRRSRTSCLLKEAAEADDVERRRLLGEVVELNMGVANALAGRYRGRGIPLEDLRQVAYLALVKAAMGFDTGRPDTDFLTYAVPTIRGELRKHFRDHGWVVRPPRRVQELQARIQQASEELTKVLQRSPRTSDLVAHLGVEEADVVEALSADGCFAPSSLDLPLLHGDGTVGDLLGREDPAHVAAEAQVVLGPLIAELTQRDRTMLRRRFRDGWTQREIAQELGIGQGQVSRRLDRILTGMRHRLGELAPPPAA